MTCCPKGGSSCVAFLGRLLIAAALLIQAIYFSMNFDAQLQSMLHTSYAKVWSIIVIALQFAAGLLILFGWLTRLGGLFMLVAVVILTWVDVSASMASLHGAPIFSSLMRYSGSIGFCGVAIYLMAFGSGKCGFDHLRHCHKKSS
ncbi:MAG: hypothetical protein A3F10_00480 [Coxiella sp. RIFCSPHIGHO2_12_FULL_42_15]|nr:MAG: hypothetical protein A3F10_00480 [Coxiella sp. RIFCSPHIGHO2_12_FULL_42_15]